MAKAETASNRAPRGTKPISQAFFQALEKMPEAQHKALVRAAMVMIRDEMKTRGEKAKMAKAKMANGKAKTPRKAAATTAVKAAKAKPAKAKTPRAGARKPARPRAPAMPEPIA